MSARLSLEVTDDAYRLACAPLHPGDHEGVVEIVRGVDDTPTASILFLLGLELQAAARDIAELAPIAADE